MRRIIPVMCTFVLATMATSAYLRSVRRAEDAVRSADALVMRQAIRAYTIDKGKAPRCLDDLVKSGYLKSLPNRPIPLENDPIVPQNGRT